MTCKKAQEFLAQAGITIENQVSAKKAPLSKMEALGLLGRVEEVYAIKGKKVVHFDLKREPATEETVALLLGPTGKLRAPTMRVGRTLLVGFNEQVYRDVLS